MNMNMASFLLVIPTTIIAVIIIIILNWLRRGQGGRSSRLPPGPRGVPLLGSLPFLSPDLPRHFTDLAATYGPILSLRVGAQLFVAVSSPSAAEEAFTVHNSIFSSRLVPDVSDALFNGGDILFAPHGPLWRMLRKVAVRELLSPKIIDTFRTLRGREMLRTLGELRASAGKAVDLRSVVYAFTINVMMGMIWDEALDEEGEARGMAEEIRKVAEGVADVLAAPNVSDFIPWLAPLDLQGLRRRARALSSRFGLIFQAVVDHKMKLGGKEGGAKDFLQLLLDVVGKEDSDMPLEQRHMRAMVLDTITAGTDTSTTTVEWVMSELMNNPATMTKLKNELNAVVGVGNSLEESHLDKLHYLNAVVKESMRLHPFCAVLLPRITSTTCNVGGYTIPPGTMFFVNVWALQRDPSLWKEPLEFRPERFLEEKDRWGYNGKSFEFMPFGAGRRSCAGLHFALRMVPYIVGSFAHSFDWGLPKHVASVNMDAVAGMAHKKEKPLMLTPYIKTDNHVQSV